MSARQQRTQHSCNTDAEPVLEKGDKRFTVFVERLSDFALVAAESMGSE